MKLCTMVAQTDTTMVDHHQPHRCLHPATEEDKLDSRLDTHQGSIPYKDRRDSTPERRERIQG
jgi:hypothetical protein